MKFWYTNSLFGYCVVHCVAGEKRLHIQGPRTRWLPWGTLGRCHPSPADRDFHWEAFFDTQGQKERYVSDICPRSEFTMHMAFNAANSRVAAVISHGLLNCSPHLKSGCLSPPSVASPAATRKALSSVIVLESMPTAPKLKEKNCYDLSSDDSV